MTTTQPLKEENDPALATGFPEPVGRLYRKPGTPSPENLPPLKVQEQVKEGTLMPSTTNVISTLSAPYLLPWATGKVTDTVIKMILHNPTGFVHRVKENPSGARKYLSASADRDRDMAGERGSKIHLACELLGKNQTIDHLNLNSKENQAVDQWKKWLDTFQPVFKHLEVTGFGKTSDNLNYGFTTDFIAEINNLTCIGDYKCVTDDTLLLLPDGSQKPAKDIVAGEEVVAWDKNNGLHTAKVLYAGDNGNHKTVTVTTHSGHKLTTTLNHPYWASRKSQGIGWLTADQLQLGDEVYVAMGWNYNKHRQNVEWKYNKYLSPYIFGVLWAIRNFNNQDFTIDDKTPIALPPISNEGLQLELREMSFKFNRHGQILPNRGISKIAKKNKVEVEEILNLINSPKLPDFVYGADTNSYFGFITGILEVFANRTISNEEILVVMNEEALTSLQALYTNYGQPATLVRDPRTKQNYLKAPFETKDTIFTHGTMSTRVISLEYSEEPEHTIALEVEGSHTHVTSGIITHNTNRKGLHEEIGLQLAANARAETISPDNKTLLPAPKIDKALGVHISEEGTLTTLINIDDKVYETFEALRYAWDFYAYKGTLHSPVFIKQVNKPSDLD